MKIISIILAAGKGSRMKSTDVNKTVLEINGKPLLQYGVETLEKISEKIVIVVGAFADSVKNVIKSDYVIFSEQKEQLGTGHAVRCAVETLEKENLEAEIILIGYGDHLAQYAKSTIDEFINFHKENGFDLSIISTENEDPNSLAWGRIVRDENGEFIGIVEQKDATDEQREIKELNSGFYCVNGKILNQIVKEIVPSKVTGEYYLTDLVEICKKLGYKTGAFKVPFDQVGLGVNTPEQLELLSKKLSQIS